MAAVITSQNQTKLSTSFALSRLQAVPVWGAPLVVRAPHSFGAKSASTTSTNCVEKRNVDRAEPCFITNASSYVHERAHWINAIRSKAEINQSFKIKIGYLLYRQGIVDETFSLDDSSNLTNLDSRLHSAMDKFAMFAVTCTHATLDAMIEIIQKENEIAMQREARRVSYIRDLQIPEISGTAEYEMVVLQPKHFLPNNSCLIRYPTQNGQVEAPKLYQVDSNGVLREAPLTANSPRYPSFCFQGDREPGAKLNPYLVILAAEIKFRRYLAVPNAPPLDAEYLALIEKTLKVANLLYWEAIPGNIARSSVFRDSNDRMEVDSDGASESQATHDSEMGFQDEANNAGGSTARQLKGKRVTRRADIDLRTLLSGCDLPLDSDDRSLLQEMALLNGYTSIDINQGSTMERMDTWRNGIAA